MNEVDEVDLEYGPECVLPIRNGGEIRSPAYPEPCSYIRVLDAEGKETGYWNADEIGEDPMLVMGAIMGAAMGTTAEGVALVLVPSQH